jgi:hypothetical protein
VKGRASPSLPSVARIASLFALVMLAALPAAAQFFWTGAGPNANWSTGANWSGGVAPPSSPSTQLDFGGLLAPLTTFVDAPWTVNRLTFNSASLSPAFVLGIGGLTMAPSPRPRCSA